ncbi:helix-turn-helix domain-containing protein [Paenibacillus sp. NEAU-GSW1]|uniref:winged helix-turn-helix transcriptional regulator n=1 Tax=Paenibacillus sp. NEAU-GSW1 TaxID=2682486 RepID=UPI0012E2AC35|nr:helix-turn-helix domain-containing protein [Paenibacillus sp. NEAU-GSW1]MUT65938.1 MarR family transcriptional regulator [Paenibacillus sp. NEAU-GSW1]
MTKYRMNEYTYNCPVELTLNTIMGKWKALILWQLRKGAKRYNELRRSLPNITDKMLAQQLKELEGAGIVTRTVYPTIPPMVEYELAELGQEIQPILKLMQQWGMKFKTNNPDDPQQSDQTPVY